jgi:hypothetical protein
MPENSLDDFIVKDPTKNIEGLDAFIVENPINDTQDLSRFIVEEKLEITEQDWTDTEENFLKKNKEKLAKLYPNFEFEESTFDINGITVKNKSTGEEESFDLAGTSFQFSDFDEFKEFVSKKPETDPVKQEVYSKTVNQKN